MDKGNWRAKMVGVWGRVRGSLQGLSLQKRSSGGRGGMRIRSRGKGVIVTVSVFLVSFLLSYVYGVAVLESPVSESHAAALKGTSAPSLSNSLTPTNLTIPSYTANSTIGTGSIVSSTTTDNPNGYNMILTTKDSNTCLRHSSVIGLACNNAGTTNKKLNAGNLVGDNQWAWSSNSGATWTLPQDNTGTTKLFELTSGPYTNDQRTITMGIKATPLMPSGAYQNTLVLTLTPGYIPEPTITSVYRTDTTINAIGPIEGGTVIDILGTNLDTAYQVFIDKNGNGTQDAGEQCTSPNIQSATKITCTTPSHPTEETRDVIVKTWGGSVTKTDGYEYGTLVEEIWGFTVDTSISTNITFNAVAPVPLQIDYGNGSWVNVAQGATISGTAIPTAGVAPLSRIRVRPQDATSYNWFPIGTGSSSSNAVLNPINHLKTLDYPVTTRSISSNRGSWVGVAKMLAYAFYDAINLTTPVSFANSNGVMVSGYIDRSFLSSIHHGNSSLTSPIDLTSLSSWNISSYVDGSFLSYAHFNNTSLTSPIDLTPLASWSVRSLGSDFLSYIHYGNSQITDPINLGPMTNWNITSIETRFLGFAHYGNSQLVSPIDLAPLANWDITSIGFSFLMYTHYGNSVLEDPIDLTPLADWSPNGQISESFLAYVHSNNRQLVAPVDLAPLSGWNITTIGYNFLSDAHSGNTAIAEPIDLTPIANWDVSGALGGYFLGSVHSGNTSLSDSIDLSPLAGWGVTSIEGYFLYRAHSGNTSLTNPINLSPLADWNVNGSIGSSFLGSIHSSNTSLTDPIDLTPLANWNVTYIGGSFLSGVHSRNTVLGSPIDLAPLASWSITSIGSYFLYAAHSYNTALQGPIDLAPLANWSVSGVIGSQFLGETHYENHTLTSPINLSPLAGWNITSIGESFLANTHYKNDALLDISSFRLPNWAKDKIIDATNALYQTFASTIFYWATIGGEPTFMDGTVISSVGVPVTQYGSRWTYKNRSSITPQYDGWN